MHDSLDAMQGLQGFMKMIGVFIIFHVKSEGRRTFGVTILEKELKDVRAKFFQSIEFF